MIKKLRIKFVVINMTMMTIMLCIILCMVYNFTRSDLETESLSMMHSIAANPFRQGRPNESSTDLKLPYFTVQVSHRGELLSTGGGYYDLSDQGFVRELVELSIASPYQTGIVDTHNFRFLKSSTPTGTVLVFSDMSSEKSTLDSLLQTSVIIGIIGFFAFLAISIFLSHWAVRPVEKAWNQQKQFVADASHELKTPLTVITTNAELLQYPDRDSGAQEQFAENILTMSRQMRLLVERMLELARADSQQPKLTAETFDLSRAAQDAVLSFEGVFFERGLTLQGYIEPGILVRGSTQSLRQVIDIFLDNAQKYAYPGTETCLRLSCSGSRCRLSVSNPGPDMGREELQAIFQRFYRGDKARGRNGGFGLGLSIAQAIVQQHRGKIWAESTDGINTFHVELPRL